MLSKKYSKGLGEPAIGEAFEKAKSGKLLVAGGQWYWVGEDKKEKIRSSDFEFLTLDENGNPWETFVSYRDGKWDTKSKDVSSELGKMDDMVGDLENIEKKIIDDQRVLDSLNKLEKLKKAKKKSPHLKLTKLQFSVFDVDLEKPVWRAEFKNWPLITYLESREQPKTVEVIIDAMSGKLLSYKEKAY
jgi:hypothetical protein